MAEKPIFDSIAHVYDDTRKLPPDIMTGVINTLSEVLGSDSKLLEVGVGTGRFSIPMCSSGLDVVGIDLSTNMLERCREKGFDMILKANACQMPFRDKHFDNAFMTHVLHLVENWECLLREVCRVTEHNLASVVSLWPRDDWPGDYYGRRVDELGYGPSQPGVSERELAEKIPPNRRIHIGTYTMKRSNDSYIDILEKRHYSSATKLPDDLHAKVVAEVRERYGGKTRAIENRVEICLWEIDSLTKFLHSNTPLS
ncbi:MAG: class I SAM-dependent methyltransferase [Candidatus Thermoplasmatota archaeon]|nr:class I SAM-dependent methyltransferase [Euryarchaeota archaeon]MBU4032700.1 class I SAM-dependent methyltransferase [Candidatus Thermoplasmatota archaeon]MBU4071901.1 class I SAM-dependent methyltransferase [Candidatus Thermoplasmatota archaeon]MBU4143795.1 class I SAM-dependent methyltransferase [Candidatus Thermoplasmatota archaeon]MBU4591371.1 class I SAM-dependent methyltransferase [Candidatus Thermoplasmatota archaeon]